jgi:hypothetical protein
MRKILPGYMSMGQQGMGGMGEMAMPIPENSLPMRGAMGPFSYIDMGGMFTILKVRQDADAADPNGYYEHPAGSVAGPADGARLSADGIVVPPAPQRSAPARSHEHQHDGHQHQHAPAQPAPARPRSTVPWKK